MNAQMALAALQEADLDGGKGCKEARKLLARPAWPADLELPRLDGQYVDQAELVGTLAEAVVDGRVSVDDLPARVAEIAVTRVGGPIWHQLHDRVRSGHEMRARRRIADDWPAIDKQITAREAAAMKQRRTAERELAEFARLLDLSSREIESRAVAARAGTKAVAAWDSRVEAMRQFRAAYALRHQLSEVGIGERPSYDHSGLTTGYLLVA